MTIYSQHVATLEHDRMDHDIGNLIDALTARVRELKTTLGKTKSKAVQSALAAVENALAALTDRHDMSTFDRVMKVNVDTNRVKAKARHNKGNKELHAQIKKLASDGLDYKFIAEKLDCSPKTVSRHAGKKRTS